MIYLFANWIVVMEAQSSTETDIGSLKAKSILSLKIQLSFFPVISKFQILAFYCIFSMVSWPIRFIFFFLLLLLFFLITGVQKSDYTCFLSNAKGAAMYNLSPFNNKKNGVWLFPICSSDCFKGIPAEFYYTPCPHLIKTLVYLATSYPDEKAK